jgi:aldehyde:ferredoxin oxidoreductase
MEWKGYTGNIITVNLTDNKISFTKQKVDDIARFIGGLGINTKLAAELIKPKIDPLSPENHIIIGAGPLVGTIIPGSSRTVGTSKFPATRANAYSCGSMSFGFNLKHAGYDHLIIYGKAEEPSYLLIWDDHIELYSASGLWGKDIITTHDNLDRKYGSCGTITIGQAGEHLVLHSLALIDKISTLGRGGFGAVMGSKNLKAIVAKGSKGITVADPERFTKLYNTLFERIRKYPLRESWHELGMLRSLPVGMLFKVSGQNQKAQQCSEKEYLKNLKKRRIACPSCPMGDKDILKPVENDTNGLPYYVTSIINPFFMFADLNGLDYNYEAILAHDKCNQYGLDYMMVAALLDYCHKLYEKGLLNEKDIGMELKLDFKTVVNIIEKIAYREGFGDILANGFNELIDRYKEISNQLPIVKGLDVVFEPRLFRLGTMEFEQIVNPKGSHVASGGSPTYAGAGSSINKFQSHFNRMGIPSFAIERIFSPPIHEMKINVGRLTRYAEDWYSILTSLGLCARAQVNRFYSLNSVTELFNGGFLSEG